MIDVTIVDEYIKVGILVVDDQSLEKMHKLERSSLDAQRLIRQISTIDPQSKDAKTLHTHLFTFTLEEEEYRKSLSSHLRLRLNDLNLFKDNLNAYLKLDLPNTIVASFSMMLQRADNIIEFTSGWQSILAEHLGIINLQLKLPFPPIKEKYTELLEKINSLVDKNTIHAKTGLPIATDESKDIDVNKLRSNIVAYNESLKE